MKFIILICLITCIQFKTHSFFYKDPLKTESKIKAHNIKQKENRSKKVQRVIDFVNDYQGVVFKENGESKKGIDAVGLTVKAFKTIHIDLPNNLDLQSEIGDRKYIGEIELGDLLFFALSEGSKKIYTVGIVTKIENGNIYFIQCNPTSGVVLDKLNDPKWKDRYILVRRIIPSVSN